MKDFKAFENILRAKRLKCFPRQESVSGQKAAAAATSSRVKAADELRCLSVVLEDEDKHAAIGHREVGGRRPGRPRPPRCSTICRQTCRVTCNICRGVTPGG
ncbi:hypothetical protein EYF80_010182 [Liparis tanakae]|uniref:Uncharacterized protein n=1 Tax=Liparis tanakae TaxID=230148 RepID=A0A4Z2ING5_9TELE|nr:hypothetical protein EYF80_010182 [Liparis tanakae]